MYKVYGILVCVLIVLFGIFSTYLAIKNWEKTREERKKANNALKAVGKINEANKEKEKMHTGDNRSDFDNSIDIVRKYTNK